jgi:Ca-activated chloride channel family protein
MLKSESADLTVHVIGYMTAHTSGMPARYATRCLPEQTGGLYITTETTEELIAALQKTLGCALLSGLDAPAPRRQDAVGKLTYRMTDSKVSE